MSIIVSLQQPTLTCQAGSVWDKIFRSLSSTKAPPITSSISTGRQCTRTEIETVTDGQCVEAELLQHFLFWTATNNTAAWLHYGCFSFVDFRIKVWNPATADQAFTSLSPITMDDVRRRQHRLNRLYSVVLNAWAAWTLQETLVCSSLLCYWIHVPLFHTSCLRAALKHIEN